MEPLLEQQRRLHEERERLVDAMVGETLIKAEGMPPVAQTPAQLAAQAASSSAQGVAQVVSASKERKPLSHKEKINADHRIRAMMDR